MDDSIRTHRGRRLTSRGKLIISRLPLHEQVAAELRDMIVSGTLAAGDKVPVNDLAAELNVSLTPLREALKVLAAENLIELMPNRGARVAPISVAGTRDLFEVLARLEGLAAELAARNMTEKQLGELEGLHERMRGHHERGEKKPYFALNRQIHDLIVACSGNQILIQTRAQLALRGEQARFISVESGAHRMEAIQDHEDVIEALRRRDAKAAHDIWYGHMIRSGEETCRVLREWEETRAAALRSPAG
ncbi:GntR family transcriptional regulator [Defluviimonas sp. SAOS-178_SWC]|uniref:GntR family transcriptional regulator n=1 Tax=Defluviimonas sp. SAOS-178_SWC TaxID=3121287 RepID=UPI003221E70F